MSLRGACRGAWLLAAVLVPAALSAADWSAQTSVQLALAAESNPQLQSGAQHGASVSVADLALSVQRQTELLDIDLQAQASVYRYSGATALNRRDQRLALEFSRQGERHALGGNAFVTRDTTLTSELGTTGNTQQNLRHRARGISIGPRWQLTELYSTAVALGWQDSSYERSAQSGLSDHHYSYVGLTNSFDASDATRATLAINVGRLDSARYAYDTYSTDVKLQLEHAWSPRWQGTISGGPSRVRAQGRRSSGSVFGASVSRQAEYLTLDASIERGTAPTGSGLLSRRDEVALHAAAALAEHLTVGARMSVISSRDLVPQLGITVGAVRYARAELSLSWNMARDWHLGLVGGHSRQKIRTGGSTALNTDARVQFAWRPSIG